MIHENIPYFVLACLVICGVVVTYYICRSEKAERIFVNE